MKVLIRIFLLAILISAISGCANNIEEVEVYEISNRFFTQQVFSIMHNSDNFLGRTIRYEGVYMPLPCRFTGDNIYFVVQFGDDCCGEEIVGFEVYLNEIDDIAAFTWVEVTGVLEEIHVAGVGDVLRINVVSMIEPEGFSP